MTMSREIKFKAWDLEKRRMLSWIVAMNIGYYSYVRDNMGETATKFKLRQYTGLKDKNGVEIYEGDIIQIPENYEIYGMNSGEKYEVYFTCGGFRLKPKYKMTAKGYWLEDDEEFEVIGNIYENPELLEEK